MVYFGLLTYVADNADDVEADTAVDTMRLGVVVDGRQQTPTFPVVDGFDNLLLINMLGKRQLNNKAVDVLICIQLINTGK